MNTEKNRISKYAEKHFVWLDLLVAGVLGAVLITLAVAHTPSESTAFAYWLDGSRQPIYRSLASINASLLGFTLTGFSVSMTFGQLPIAKRIRRANQLTNLFGIFVRAMRWLGACAVFSLFALLVDRDSSPILWIPVLLIFLQFGTAVRFLRCVWILQQVSKIISKSDSVATD